MSQDIIQRTQNVIQKLQSHGAEVIPISLPSTAYALSSYYVLASAEASSNLARYDGVQYGEFSSFLTRRFHSILSIGSQVRPPPGVDLTKTSTVYAQTRSVGFGPEVQKRILLGTYALSAE